jgi:hypothetical protein
MFTGPNIVKNGLVLWLDAANTKSYPGSGTNWADLSGNNYSGSLINGPTFSSANNGGIVFDGVNDYVPTLALSSGSATSNYTFSTWVKPVVTGSYFLNRGNDGAGAGWSLLAGTSIEGKYYIGVVTTIPSLVGYSLTSSFAASLNTWANITGVWLAGSSLSLYVNGLPNNSIAIPGTVLRSSTLGWVLGRITTTIYSPGTISTSLVYDRTLSAQEVLQNYNATKARYGL